MIVATNIVKPENKQGYEISGADGYENATEELNRIGALYGQGYGAIGGRSITLKDINKITGYNATVGETKTYNSNNVSKKGFRFFDEANNKWALLTNLFSNVTKSITNTFYEYSVNSISSKAMQTIFGSDGYWVANNSVKTNDNDVEYGMFYVNERWLGGMLTNFRTIQSRIARLKEIETMATDGTFEVLPKKEVIALKKEWEKLEKNLGGIKEMKKIPDAIFVVDPKKERICVQEAHTLGIPLIGICDTNCDPEELDYVIPGNDDAIRAVKLIVSKMADAVVEANQGTVDVEAAEEFEAEEAEEA